MIASIIVPFIRYQARLMPGVIHHREANPRLDASLLQCTLRNLAQGGTSSLGDHLKPSFKGRQIVLADEFCPSGFWSCCFMSQFPRGICHGVGFGIRRTRPYTGSTHSSPTEWLCSYVLIS